MARKTKAPAKGKRYPLNMRTTLELRQKIEDAAELSGRSLVQEVEYRLEASFQREQEEKMIQAAAEAAAKTTGGKLFQLFELREERRQRIQILDKLKGGDLGTETDNIDTTPETIARTQRKIAELDQQISDLDQQISDLTGPPGTTGSKEKSE